MVTASLLRHSADDCTTVALSYLRRFYCPLLLFAVGHNDQMMDGRNFRDFRSQLTSAGRNSRLPAASCCSWPQLASPGRNFLLPVATFYFRRQLACTSCYFQPQLVTSSRNFLLLAATCYFQSQLATSGRSLLLLT